jgi:hypothetical protein
MSTKFLVGSLAFVLLTTAGLTFASNEVDNVISRLMLSHQNNNILTPLTQSQISSSGRASYADCGVANDKVTSKIIGGGETAPNEFPWQAILVVKSESDESDETHQCGGSLIADRWILTSASCLEGPPGYESKIKRQSYIFLINISFDLNIKAKVKGGKCFPGSAQYQCPIGSESQRILGKRNLYPSQLESCHKGRRHCPG